MLEMKDIFVPIASAIGVGIVGYSFKKAIDETLGRIHDHIVSVDQRLNGHVEECDKVDKAVLQEKIDRTEEEVEKVRKFTHWASNALSTIAIKLNINIGIRP